MNVSFLGTYKISLNENKGKSEDIFSATDVVFQKLKTDALTDYPQKDGIYDVVWTIAVDDSKNKFVDSILSSRGIKFTRKDYSELYDREEIKKRIVLPDFLDDKKFSLTEVNTKKFNEAYKAHSFAYVGDDNNVEFKERYKGVEEYIRTDKPIDASIVYAKDAGSYPEIDFQDGRHRYAYMRNIGMEKIPLAMNKETEKVLKKYDLL